MSKTVAQVLEGIQGVWEGTYAHHKPDGTLIEKYSSRQETRLIGARWDERIIYQREGQEPEVLDFRATVSGNDAIFDDDRFVGKSYLIEESTIIFPYYWRDNPGRTILEAIHHLNDDYRTRIWQSFENGRLDKLTIIEEHRVPDGHVEDWF